MPLGTWHYFKLAMPNFKTLCLGIWQQEGFSGKCCYASNIYIFFKQG